jgi:hypothetical protein
MKQIDRVEETLEERIEYIESNNSTNDFFMSNDPPLLHQDIFTKINFRGLLVELNPISVNTYALLQSLT